MDVGRHAWGATVAGAAVVGVGVKIAILADIHANLAALEVAAADVDGWRPDVTIVNGDVVNRGPRPLECLRFVLAREAADGWVLLRGNHEDYVLSRVAVREPEGHPLRDAFRMPEWTAERLGADVAALARWPGRHEVLAPDGTALRAVHASMRGNRDGIYRQTPDEEVALQIAPAPAVFVTSHTHRALVREVDGTRVVNTGAVGLPFDGDWRAAYARATWHAGVWRVEVVRLPYDRARADRDFELTGALDEAGPLMRLARLELATARSQIHRWADHYMLAVAEGRIGMAESVRRVWEEIEGDGG